MILVDTSVWIDHLRHGVARLAELLEQGQVIAHPYVRGELACGALRQREQILGGLADLPQAVVADDKEVLQLIEQHQLMGRGIGYIDAHLLAAVMLSAGARLWTRDRRLQQCAVALGLNFDDRHEQG